MLISETARFTGSTLLARQVRDDLSQAPASPFELAERLGASVADVEIALASLLQSGQAQPDVSNIWSAVR